MILPERDHAAQKRGIAEKWAIGRRWAADDDVIAAAGSSVFAIVRELLRCELIRFGFGEDGLINLFQFFPAGGGRKIDFDHTRIRRDAEGFQARVGRWRVAFQPNWFLEISAGVLYGSEQI